MHILILRLQLNPGIKEFTCPTVVWPSVHKPVKEYLLPLKVCLNAMETDNKRNIKPFYNI